jgi:uncharacterized membrane protein
MRGIVSLTPWRQFLLALCLATAVSIGLLVADAIANRTFSQNYLLVNLVLAWVPFGLALWLRYCLRHKLWSSWEAMSVSVLWLIFLPNAFYMISDFIHLTNIDMQQLLFNTVMFTSFIYIGVLLGFTSLYLVQQELAKRFSPRATTIMVGFLLFICSFAIYIGRDLRWNTWNVFTDPAGILFEVSTRLLHPSQYSQVLLVALPFFALLISMYFVAWKGIKLLGLRRS